MYVPGRDEYPFIVPKPLKRRYVSVYFDESALDRIDRFRWQHRFISRTEAIRFLVDYALDQKPKPAGSVPPKR